MDLLVALWFPILLSAVLTFVASSLTYMVLPLHRKEWSTLPDEGAFLERLRAIGVRPGKYMYPCYGKGSAKDPQFLERWNSGPHGLLQVYAQRPSFARNLASTFLLYLVVGVFVAYLAASALPRGAAYGEVFRIAGTGALLAHLFGWITDAIWFQRPAMGVLASVVDAVLFSLLTAGSFAGFWPAA